MSSSEDQILDDNGYPSDAELKRVEEWPWQDGFRPLMAYVFARWKYADIGYWQQEGDRFAISTGGWSGNEDLIQALEANQMFRSLCAYSWRRGGHYVYDVREWGGGEGDNRILVRDPATPSGHGE